MFVRYVTSYSLACKWYLAPLVVFKIGNRGIRNIWHCGWYGHKGAHVLA